MNDRKEKSRRKTNQIWLTIGAVILIILLLLWLTDAFFLGDTDVSAPPAVEAIMPFLI